MHERRSRSIPTGDAVATLAVEGTTASGGPLPHLDRIQASFGRFDVGAISAHVGGAATRATEALGAEAYATGKHVVFGGAPSLHTAAHEAAHVVQQRAGVAFKGLGSPDDAFERHADAVADRVVAGESAEDLLAPLASGATPAAGDHVQRRVKIGGVVMQDPSKEDVWEELHQAKQKALGKLHSERAKYYCFKDDRHLKAFLDKGVPPPVEEALEDETTRLGWLADDVEPGEDDLGQLGPALPQGEKGFGLGPRRMSMFRTNSRDQLVKAPGTEFHAELRKDNLAHHSHTDQKVNVGKRGKRLKNPKNINTVAAGLTITYDSDTVEGAAWSGKLAVGWNSGYAQENLEQDCEETNFADALDTYFDAKAEDDDWEGPTPLKGEGEHAFQGKNSGKNASLLSHSETAFAADPDLGERVRDLLATFVSIAKPGKVLRVVVDVDSYNKTMCMGACRHALMDVKRRVEGWAAEYFAAKNIETGKKFGADLRVTSADLFVDQAQGNTSNRAMKRHLDSEESGEIDLDTTILVTGKKSLDVEYPPDEMHTTVETKTAVDRHKRRKHADPATIRSALARIDLSKSNFYVEVQKLLLDSKSLEDIRVVLSALDTTAIEHLLADLLEDKNFQLGYEGALPDDVLRMVLWELLSLLEKSKDVTPKKVVTRRPPKGGGGDGGMERTIEV